MKVFIFLLSLSIIFVYTCSENNNNKNEPNTSQIENGFKKKNRINRTELLESLYKTIIHEREIFRIYAIQTFIDTNYFLKLKKLEIFNTKDVSNYYKEKSIPIKQNWDSKRNIVSEKRAKLLEDNYELNEDSAYFKISFPFFNNELSYALINIRYECGRYCSYDELCIYQLENSQWKFKKIINGNYW